MNPYRSAKPVGLPWPHCAPKASMWRLAKAWLMRGAVFALWRDRPRRRVLNALLRKWAGHLRLPTFVLPSEFTLPMWRDVRLHFPTRMPAAPPLEKVSK
jgi:hypothetical protein